MIRYFNFGPNTRVAALGNTEAVHLVLVAGSSKVAMNLHGDAARAVVTEVRDAMPVVIRTTNRPAAPSKPAANWGALLQRLHAGRSLPGDAQHVAALLHYLGVKTT